MRQTKICDPLFLYLLILMKFTNIFLMHFQMLLINYQHGFHLSYVGEILFCWHFLFFHLQELLLQVSNNLFAMSDQIFSSLAHYLWNHLRSSWMISSISSRILSNSLILEILCVIASFLHSMQSLITQKVLSSNPVTVRSARNFVNHILAPHSPMKLL